MLQRKILLVDDQPINRAILRKMLSNGEYQFLEAADGREAIEILHQQHGKVAVIMLDLLMPGMSGQEFLDVKATDPVLVNIPVIVTTQFEDASTEVVAKGVNGFLLKPYNALIIQQRLANLIKLHETVDFVNAIERDCMTGVYTKEAFYRLAADIIAANADHNYDILVTDFERFKLVNELFGMEEGNKLLRYWGQSLDQATRSGKIQLVGRNGGDVFMLLVDKQQGSLNDLLTELGKTLQAYPLKLTLELKVGCYPVDNETPLNKMCFRASMAADSIKGKYGKHLCVYEDSLRRRLLQEQSILNSMQAALTNHEFVVYYQPKFSMATRTMVGAEALVRWEHPGQGLIPPDAFIPLFERNGFITDIDMYIWEKVCADIAVWYQKYGKDMVPISINVSRVDIFNPGLNQILLDLVHKHQIPIELLHLEITESAAMTGDSQFIQAIRDLDKTGFIIEMDDFGKGYSSLNMLSELPIDIIKIDRDFLRSSNDNVRQRDVICFIIGLAKKLGIGTIAEGVETEEQLEFLRATQCDMGQGFFYAKPMPQEQFAKMLAMKAGQ